MSGIHHFRHRSMATHFEVRIANEEKEYAQRAAQAALDLLPGLEARLSRFRADSDIARIARLAPGESMRLSEPAYACLEVALRMERLTHAAFSPTPTALQTQASPPQWSLLQAEQAIRCEHGILRFDLGAIGKGFTLDRMANLLCEWDCCAFLLVAGGSSILAGEAAADQPGWSCGLGDDDASHRLLLTHASLSGSGLAVKGEHILDPRTGGPALRQNRTWALANTAAESDALSTAAMVLSTSELNDVLDQDYSWLVFLEAGDGMLRLGHRSSPGGP